MAVTAGALDRRIQFRRRTLVNGPLGSEEVWADHGSPISGSRSDVSDSEKFAAATVQATIDARFVVRFTAFTRAITPVDRLICEGRDYNIIGVKEVGERRRFLEISARALVA